VSGAAIAMRDLAVEVRGHGRILGPLSLEVAPGEHALVVGPSGAGKTTLLRVIAGLETPSAGELALFGRRASSAGRVELAPERRGVGMLFQEGALWPHMSARRTLGFVLARRGTPRRDRARRIGELLEQVDLAGYEKRKPGTLSGGEAQRLALARALAAEARILLLDEPLGPLDPARRSELLARLGELQRRHELTILHVTHDPEEAASVATRTLTLEGGLLA